MNPLHLKLSLLFLLPVVLLLGNTVPASTDGPVLKTGYTDPPLADFLNSDGTFNITPGFSGQVDISGYHIQLDECAGPVAAPDGMASATGTWATLGSGLNGTVNTIVAAANGDLYVGGSFTEAGGITANRIAKWDGANWSGVGTGLSSIGNVIEESPSGEIYVGGFFGSDNGFPSVTLNRIARLIPPVPCDIAITSVDKTDETCPGEDDGSITINATCSSCASILYSIDGGATTQASPTFTGLMPGNYQPYVVDSGDAACSDEAAEVIITGGVDNAPPSISCPTNVSVNVDAGTCGAVVDYNVAVSDNCAVATSPGSGGGAEVLLLYDQNTANTTSLRNAIEAGGHTVTLAFAGGFNETNPSLAAFDAVIHLEGQPYGGMPVAGRTALADFAMNQGGVYIGTEFIGYNVDYTNSYLEMEDLVLLQVGCSGGSCGNSAVEYSIVSGQENHPVLTNRK